MQAQRLLAGWLLLVLACPASAAPPAEIVLDQLNNPCGVAVQPETGHVYVAESGAGRVVRIVDGKAQPVIVGFPLDVYGKGPEYKIGPLGLAFVSKNILVVGGGGLADGAELLRIYNLPAPEDEPIEAAKMSTSFRLTATELMKGEGNFYAVAVTPKAIFVSCNGDDEKGWVSKAVVSGTQFGPFKRFIATREQTGVDAPVAITVNPERQLVVGQAGELTEPKDSLLTFYDTGTGKKLLSLATGLYDLTGLAYSPKTKRLFAIDFAWMDSTAAGLFEISTDRSQLQQKLQLTKIAPLERPTSLAFAPDGTLYLTVLGQAVAEGAKPRGKLLRIAAGL
jgi:DNA-binding beta-propeller fold protein YncE